MSSSSNLKKMPASSSSASPTTDVVFVHFRRGGAVTAPMPLLKTPHADGKPTTECLAQCEMVWVKQDCTKSGDTGWVQVQSVKRSQKVGWVKRDYLRQPETRVALADIEGTKFTEGDDVVLLDDDGEGVCSIMDGKGGVAEVLLFSLLALPAAGAGHLAKQATQDQTPSNEKRAQKDQARPEHGSSQRQLHHGDRF